MAPVQRNRFTTTESQIKFLCPSVNVHSGSVVATMDRDKYSNSCIQIFIVLFLQHHVHVQLQYVIQTGDAVQYIKPMSKG